MQSGFSTARCFLRPPQCKTQRLCAIERCGNQTRPVCCCSCRRSHDKQWLQSRLGLPVQWGHFPTGHASYEADDEGAGAKDALRQHNAMHHPPVVTAAHAASLLQARLAQPDPAAFQAAQARRRNVHRDCPYIPGPRDAGEAAATTAAAAAEVAAGSSSRDGSGSGAEAEAEVQARAAQVAATLEAFWPAPRSLEPVQRPEWRGQQHCGIDSIGAYHCFITLPGEQPAEGGRPVVFARQFSCYCQGCWADIRWDWTGRRGMQRRGGWTLDEGAAELHDAGQPSRVSQHTLSTLVWPCRAGIGAVGQRCQRGLPPAQRFELHRRDEARQERSGRQLPPAAAAAASSNISHEDSGPHGCDAGDPDEEVVSFAGLQIEAGTFLAVAAASGEELDDFRLFRAAAAPRAAAQASVEADDTEIEEGDSVVHGCWMEAVGWQRGGHSFQEGEEGQILESQALAVVEMRQAAEGQGQRRQQVAAAAEWVMAPVAFYGATQVVESRARRPASEQL